MTVPPRLWPRPFRRALCLVSVALISFSGCDLGPDYSRPPLDIPSGWNDASGGYTDGSPHALWPSEDWWKGFSSPMLNQFMETAEIANDDIKAAVARVREADAEAKIAGAPLLPQVGASGTAAWERQPATNGFKTYPATLPLLTASYEIDFWGKNAAAFEAAEATAQGTAYDRAAVEITVMTSVATTYFQALELHDRIDVAERNFKNAEDTLDGLKAEEKAGIETSLDVAQQEVVVATASAAIPPLRQNLRQTLDALAILLGRRPEGFDLKLSTLEALTEPAVRPGLPSELLERRPDVAEAEQALIAANANIKVARADFYPSIVLTAQGGLASTALSTMANPANAVFVLGAGVTQPIFEGGALEGQLEYTEARRDELLANYHKVVISALGNVEDALVALSQTQDQLQRQQTTVEKARLAYTLAQDQLKVGTINILTVLNTEIALFTAEDALVQIRFLHLQALLGLYNALGGGWHQA